MSHHPVIRRDVEVRLNGVSLPQRGLRIAHVSDFHLWKWNRTLAAAQELLCSMEFDFLVATGDFGTHPGRWSRAVDLLKRFFEPIAARAPVYAVLGNHDHPTMADESPSSVRFLRNESISLEFGDTTVELAGLDQSLTDHEDLEAALPGDRKHDITILLAHYPSTIFRVPHGRVDLVLSGHTHGGQIRFPWLGCVWPNDQISRHMARGICEISGTVLHTNPGIGVALFMPFRINCPAEVTLLTIVPRGAQPQPTLSPKMAKSAPG